MIEPKQGIVYLVGAGPGDPGLFTLRGMELLQRCEVLVYDALVSPEILEFCPATCEKIYAGKRGASHVMEQDEINEVLAQKASAGKMVVRLKGGDPYLFGRGGEEALYLKERGLAFETVPGITSGMAAPAYAGIPVTHREHGSALTLVTGHEDPTKPETAIDWAALSKIGTLCFYMGVKNLDRITGNLMKHQPASTPVAVIQWGTTPRQKSVHGTLADIVEKVKTAGITAPAITVVGGVASLRDQLNFFETRPLFGKRIVVTRSRDQQSDVARQLREMGAEALSFPTIRFETPADNTPMQKGVAALSSFDWVVVASTNAVDFLFAEMERQGKDARAFGKAKVAAVGPSTAGHLAKKGIKADLVPPKFVAEEIITALKNAGALNGKKFFLPRADIGRPALPDGLRALGAEVTEATAYKTVLETGASGASAGQELALEALEKGEVDAVTFTSSSTAKNFVEILGKERLQKALTSPRLRCLSIGPVTSQTMKELGLPVHGEAAEHDISGLVRLIRAKI